MSNPFEHALGHPTRHSDWNSDDATLVDGGGWRMAAPLSSVLSDARAAHPEGCRGFDSHPDASMVVKSAR